MNGEKRTRNGTNITRISIIEKMMDPVADVTKADAGRVVDSIIRGITEGLIKDGEVKISGFGKFVLQDKRQRKGRNPRTGEELLISSRRVLKFRISDTLKDQMNENPLGVGR